MCNYQCHFEKAIISELDHRVTYVYINFQQIHVNRSVKTVLTNIFANNRKLPKFASTNSNLENNRLFPTCVKVYRAPIFSKIGLMDQCKL